MFWVIINRHYNDNDNKQTCYLFYITKREVFIVIMLFPQPSFLILDILQKVDCKHPLSWTFYNLRHVCSVCSQTVYLTLFFLW